MSSLQVLPLLRFFSTLTANWLLVDFSVHFLTMANFPLLYVHGVHGVRVCVGGGGGGGGGGGLKRKLKAKNLGNDFVRHTLVVGPI